MKRVLFVCTGNSCRSPMAEGLMRHLAAPGTVDVRSAGVAAGRGEPASPNAIAAMKQIGVDVSDHRSQRINDVLVRDADAIFVMTYGHLDVMLMLFPGAAEKTFLVREFEDDEGSREVADPMGGGMAAYQVARDQLRDAMPSLITFLQTSQVPAQLMKQHHSRLTIAVAADHAGFELKEDVRTFLEEEGYTVTDFGTSSATSVDYPDFAHRVGEAVREGNADFGVLVCKTGIGMSISANKLPGIRAALVDSPEHARLSREHNDANVIALGADTTDAATARELLHTWLTTPFAGGRHERRVSKMEVGAEPAGTASALALTDPAVFQSIEAEERRQSDNIELIASENFTSRAVMEAQGSCLTNKYAEGYPGKRWYGGCENVDVIEQLAIDRAKQLFQAEHANVQPHSGSQANTAVYFSVLKPGDRILTMNLSHGGHLTHGHPMNFSGKLYDVVHYGVSPESETIDYDALAAQALECKPKMITVGASAYSRIIDFKRMREIADSVGAYLFADMAHIAGLVAAGVHPSPVPYADFVTSTTHKTLRGPRGGIILCGAKYAKDIDSLVFPGVQGGPLMHVIAAKAVCFQEALQPSFTAYQQQVAKNALALCNRMKHHGYRIVSGTTENHVMLVDLQPKNITGKEAQEALDHAGITVNKNAVPFDKQSPFKAGGIRLGSPAVTTRGFREKDMERVADLIHEVLSHLGDTAVAESVQQRVREMMRAFPLPS